MCDVCMRSYCPPRCPNYLGRRREEKYVRRRRNVIRYRRNAESELQDFGAFRSKKEKTWESFVEMTAKGDTRRGAERRERGIYAGERRG